MPAAPHFSTRKSLLFASLLVVGFFATAEVALRFVPLPKAARPRILLRGLDVDIDFPFMQLDATSFWAPRPGFSGEFLDKQVTINSLGLRGPEVPTPKPRARRRVLCLGDSITFGYGVDDGDSYPARLGKLVADRGHDVLNGGVTGYTSHQVLARLERLLPLVAPDIVTVAVGWNDGNLRPTTDREYAERLQQVMAAEGFFDHSSIYRHLRSLYSRAAFRSALRSAQLAWSTPRVPADHYRDNLRRIAVLARAKGARVVFLALPHQKAPGAKRPTVTYMPELLATARGIGVPVLSVGELSWETDLESNAVYFIDSIHLSPEGAARMADEIARQLVALGWI